MSAHLTVNLEQLSQDLQNTGKSWYFRAAAAAALGETGDIRAIDILRIGLYDEGDVASDYGSEDFNANLPFRFEGGDEVRNAARAAIINILVSEKDFDKVVVFLKSKDSLVQGAVIDALVQREDERAIEPLIYQILKGPEY